MFADLTAQASAAQIAKAEDLKAALDAATTEGERHAARFRYVEQQKVADVFARIAAIKSADDMTPELDTAIANLPRDLMDQVGGLLGALAQELGLA